jgi:hypothetical protein
MLVPHCACAPGARKHGKATIGMKCRDCSTEDSELHYRSGKMTRCYDCQNYYNLTTKATGGGVNFAREDFVAWKRSQPRECHYCGFDLQKPDPTGPESVN